MSNQKTCGNCANFLGMGDWDLCCKDPPEEDIGFAGHLCYADTPACRKFIPSIKVMNKGEFIATHCYLCSCIDCPQTDEELTTCYEKEFKDEPTQKEKES